MTPAHNNEEESLQALTAYLASVDWSAEEDHFDSGEYIGVTLSALATGVSREEEKSLLGELLARTYHQSHAIPVILKLVYPLLLLCKTGKLQFRAEVLEFLTDIAEKHLYLRYRLLGLKPVKVDFIGDVYTTTEQAEASINKRRIYYEEICRHTTLIQDIITDKMPAVSTLAVKLYLLCLYENTPEDILQKIITVRELIAAKGEAAEENLLTGSAIILQQSAAQLPESLVASVTPGHYLSIARVFNAATTEDVVDAEILLQSSVQEYTTHPWADGYLAVLACAALLKHNREQRDGIDAILRAIRFQRNHAKKYTAGGPHWLPHQLMAEYLVARFFGDYWASLTKVPWEALSSLQQYILQKLSGEMGIYTYLQSYLGLPAEKESWRAWMPQ
ncbi:hypothetical protein [Chitinophaga qingshengii]|uniref:Uncharacterized protein n=1 Tax=Chitinophaga qingshengii TaxID=1569794 RepID=A0ABR7TXS0_9BACT|nr:hypothetical protein [Chitinophaga qingshengii]MBC9934468.1 hypothetical protein [Chitinophaga qingshengii]